VNSSTPAPRSTGKSSGLAALLLVLAAGGALADVVTVKDGPAVAGSVVSVDRKSVTVKTKSQTRVIPRSSVLRVDFGTDLITGLAGNSYTNADYRVRLTAPAGWSFSEQPGLDISAQKGNGVLFLKAIPSAGPSLEEGMIQGAIGGMLANVPDAKTDPTEEIKWGGLAARKVKVHSAQLEMVIVFIHRPGHMVMLGLGVPPAEVATLPPMIADWEKGFQTIPD
jgi:hypothetical protein